MPKTVCLLNIDQKKFVPIVYSFEANVWDAELNLKFQTAQNTEYFQVIPQSA